MKKQSKAIWLALASVLSLHAAQAATNVSATSASEALPSLKDKLSIPFTSTIYGPSSAGVAKGDFTKTPAEFGGDPTTAENILGVYYKLAPKLTLGAAERVFAYTDAAKPYLIDNPWLRAKHASLITAGNFNMAADFRVYLPVARQVYLFGLRSSQVAEYQIPHTRWTVGWNSFIRAYALSDNSPNYDSLVEPTLTYQLSPRMQATFLSDVVQLIGNRAKGVYNLPVNVQGGVNFDVTPNFSVNPRLVVYPGAADFLGSSHLWVDVALTLL